MNDPGITLNIPPDSTENANNGPHAILQTPSTPQTNGPPKRYRSTPAKTFQCTGFGECRMVFSRSEHLARHIRKHTGERPFPCHCSKQFSRLDNLRQHAQTVHADKQEQNEKMMKELTSLHASMSPAAGTSKKSTKRAARAAASEGVSAVHPYPHGMMPRPPSSQGYEHHPEAYTHQMTYQGVPAGQMAYMPPDGHYAHPYDPHASYPTFPLSEAFPANYQQQQNQHQPPQLHVQPSYPTHPVYDYNRRSGSDGDSPVDNNPPPNSAHDSVPSQSPATPTSANVPSSATSLHHPHPQATYSHPQYTHHDGNGVPYPSRSPLPTPPPQSFRQPLRGVRDGAAGGEYYQQPLPLSQQQHANSYYAQQHQQQSQRTPLPAPSPHGQSGNGVPSDSHSGLVQVKHEEYSFIPPVVKSEQSDNRSAASRASSTDSPPEQRDTGQYHSDDNGRNRVFNGRGGNDSAAGVSAGGFGGEQRFPGEFSHLQHHPEQQQRGRILHIPYGDRHGYGPASSQERRYEHVPVPALDSASSNDRPGTAPASFTHNGQFFSRPATSATTGSPTAAQSSRVSANAMATSAATSTADKYYSSIGGFREHNYAHESSAPHRGGSNSPPFRFGAPSPQQQNRPDVEQHWQSSGASLGRSPPGGSFATTAASRPGNLLRPLPGWSAATTTAPANTLGFNTANDSPFTYNAPPLGYPLSADHKAQFSRKRPHPGSDDDEPRTFSSRPGTRSGRDHVDEPPRPTSRRLSVMELCNTQSGGGGNGLPDGFDNRPRTSSGRFTSSTSGTISSGPSSSFSFPASASNPNLGNHHPNGLRPSSSGGLGSRPSSSAGRGLEQYALNLNGGGGSSRPGTASGQSWSLSRGIGSGPGQDDGGVAGLGRRASTGIVLPPLHLSSTSAASASSSSSSTSPFAFTGGHDAHGHGGSGSGRDGNGGDGLAGSVTSGQSRISTPRQAPPGLRA